MQVNQPKEGGAKATTPRAEHTLVVRYAAGEEPSYSAATEILGGRLVAVDFDGNRLAGAEAKELLPADWKALLGRWAHAALSQWQAELHGIRVEYVSHGADGGHHWQYRVEQGGAA